jgi:hypothetical protein
VHPDMRIPRRPSLWTETDPPARVSPEAAHPIPTCSNRFRTLFPVRVRRVRLEDARTSTVGRLTEDQVIWGHRRGLDFKRPHDVALARKQQPDPASWSPPNLDGSSGWSALREPDRSARVGDVAGGSALTPRWGTVLEGGSAVRSRAGCFPKGGERTPTRRAPSGVVANPPSMPCSGTTRTPPWPVGARHAFS